MSESEWFRSGETDEAEPHHLKAFAARRGTAIQFGNSLVDRSAVLSGDRHGLTSYYFLSDQIGCEMIDKFTPMRGQ